MKIKNYNEMSTAKLLQEKCYLEQLKGLSVEIALDEVNEIIQARFAEAKAQKEIEKSEQVEEVIINVTYEKGYRWSVDVNGGESVDTGLTKREAMELARQIKKQHQNASINEYKMSKSERKENISYLHENGYSYTKF